jgi:hypothetical protein
VERFFCTINQMCLPELPGYAPRGAADRAGQAKLTLAELDTAIVTFIREIYNPTPHGETGMPPQRRWEAGAFIARMPGSLEARPAAAHRCQAPQDPPGRNPLPGLRYLGPPSWPPTSATA